MNIDYHTFRTDIATLFGVDCATLLDIIKTQVQFSWVSSINYYDNKYWFSITAKKLQKLLPFFTIAKIHSIIKKLKEYDLIEIGDYNTKKSDKTEWFTLTEKSKAFYNGDSSYFGVSDTDKFIQLSKAMPLKDSKPIKVNKNRNSDEFEKVWALYDRKGSKKDAEREWMQLTNEEVSKCITFIKALINCTEREYRKDFENLLSKKQWESKLVKRGITYYDPEQTQESIDLNEAIRGETMYPKTKDGIYISHSENPMLDIVFDGYKNDNRPDGCKIMYCGIIFEWNKEEKKFKKQENR